MVVVVVIVFNYTSPKFHKLVFSDYRQLSAFKENYKYIYFSISCSQALISDTCLHSQTKTPIKHLGRIWTVQSSSTIEKICEFSSTFWSMIFPWVKATISPSKNHIKKIRVDPARNWLVTLAYKQRIRISGEMDPLYYP